MRHCKCGASSYLLIYRTMKQAVQTYTKIYISAYTESIYKKNNGTHHAYMEKNA